MEAGVDRKKGERWSLKRETKEQETGELYKSVSLLCSLSPGLMGRGRASSTKVYHFCAVARIDEAGSGRAI